MACKPDSLDIDFSMPANFTARLSLYSAMSESVRRKLDRSLPKAVARVVGELLDWLAAHPTEVAPALVTGFRYRWPDGSWKDAPPGFWDHASLAEALRLAGHSTDALVFDSDSGGALCCEWHKEHYDPGSHGQRLNTADPDVPDNAAAFARGSTALMNAWRESRNSAAADEDHDFDADWWGERADVPEFPPSEDITYGEARIAHMERSWLEHGRKGPKSSWDPECWDPLVREPHIGPWYVDYAELFMQNPNVQLVKGYIEVKSFLEAMTDEEKAKIATRVARNGLSYS